jgi:ribonuclease VapC
MIVDTSVLVAILKREPGWETFAKSLDEADNSRISASTYVELAIVVDRWKSPALSRRGSGHPANLNFGDCFSYALARDKREPILYKGDDFVHTDLRPALGRTLP